jgi:hypothetical protein
LIEVGGCDINSVSDEALIRVLYDRGHYYSDDLIIKLLVVYLNSDRVDHKYLTKIKTPIIEKALLSDKLLLLKLMVNRDSLSTKLNEIPGGVFKEIIEYGGNKHSDLIQKSTNDKQL